MDWKSIARAATAIISARCVPHRRVRLIGFVRVAAVGSGSGGNRLHAALIAGRTRPVTEHDPLVFVVDDDESSLRATARLLGSPGFVERRVSHAFIMDVPTLNWAVDISDATINILPTLEDKMYIVQNAIDLCHAHGYPQPQVAILSAMETVNPEVPSTRLASRAVAALVAQARQERASDLAA